jgi:hypothetical protein
MNIKELKQPSKSISKNDDEHFEEFTEEGKIEYYDS